MIRSFASPDLRAVWRGHQPDRIHPRLAFAVRRDLAIIHAAIDGNDLLQACGERLQPLKDLSVPFDIDDDPEATDPARPTDEQAPEPHFDAPNVHHDLKTLNVGYGWWLIFQFRSGDAQGIDLETIPDVADD